MVQKYIVISMIAPVILAGILILGTLTATGNAQEDNNPPAVDCNANPSDPSCGPTTSNPPSSNNNPPAVDCNANPSDPSCGPTTSNPPSSNNNPPAAGCGLGTDNSTCTTAPGSTGETQQQGQSLVGANPTQVPANNGTGNAQQQSSNTTSPSGSTAKNATSTGVPYNVTSTGVPESMKNSNNETTADFAKNILAVHNSERAAVKVPLLVWSDKLAADAATWADHMTVTREFVHCGATPGCDTHGEGENMQAETYFMPNAPSTTKLQAGWVNEKNYYQKWATNSLPKTANWTGWFPGHYNQMVWNTTKEVGCATGFTPVLPHTAFGDNLHGVYLICRYSPAGNIDGQKPY